MDLSKIENIEIEGIDSADYPDFCDAFIAAAEYGGKQLTEKQLDILNNDSSFVYSCVIDLIY